MGRVVTISLGVKPGKRPPIKQAKQAKQSIYRAESAMKARGKAKPQKGLGKTSTPKAKSPPSTPKSTPSRSRRAKKGRPRKDARQQKKNYRLVFVPGNLYQYRCLYHIT